MCGFPQTIGSHKTSHVIPGKMEQDVLKKIAKAKYETSLALWTPDNIYTFALDYTRTVVTNACSEPLTRCPLPDFLTQPPYHQTI